LHSFESVPGHGLDALVDGHRVWIGNRTMVLRAKITEDSRLTQRRTLPRGGVTPSRTWLSTTVSPPSSASRIPSKAEAAGRDLRHRQVSGRHPGSLAVRRVPSVHAHLEAAREEIRAFAAFPRGLWRQIWLNNPTSYSTARSAA
jgi:hypothetical protein